MGNEGATGALEEISQRDHSVTSEYRIFGPPGTGKTTNLARQIRRAVDQYGPASVLVTSFCRAAAEEGQAAICLSIRTGSEHCIRIATTAAPAWGPVSSKAPAFPVRNGDTPEGSVMGFKVEEKDGKPMLAPAWISRNMGVPEPPIVANGIVFAVSSGENTLQANNEGRLMDSAQRLKTAPGHAILYALDADTGKELFSSSDTMPSITHFSGIAIFGGRVYVTTYDSTLYSFGLEGQ